MVLPMNCNHLKIYLILILLLSFGCHSFAQNKNDANGKASTGNKIILDSVNIGYASPLDTALYKSEFEEANDSILKWKQMHEFGYMAYIDSLLRKRKNLTIDTVNINGKGKSKKAANASSKNNSGVNNFINSLPVKIFFWIVAIVFMEIQEADYVVKYPEVLKLSDRDINTIKNVISLFYKNHDTKTCTRVARKVMEVLKIQTDLYAIDFLEKLLADYNYLAK